MSTAVRGSPPCNLLRPPSVQTAQARVVLCCGLETGGNGPPHRKGNAMVMRWCGHCEAEIEVSEEVRVVCPICGLDPTVSPLAFDDAPAFFLADAMREDQAVTPV